MDTNLHNENLNLAPRDQNWKMASRFTQFS